MISLLIEILVSLVLIALFCIFMDALTLIVEYAWVLPVIAGVYLIARLVFYFVLNGRNRKVYCNATPDLSESPANLKKLVVAAAVDGVISEREKRDLVARGAELGLSAIESEAIIAATLQELSNN